MADRATACPPAAVTQRKEAAAPAAAAAPAQPANGDLKRAADTDDSDSDSEPAKKAKPEEVKKGPLSSLIDAGKEARIEAEARAARQRALLPLEQRVRVFRQMLAERDVSAFSTWEKELKKIVCDCRYLLLTSEERKQVGFVVDTLTTLVGGLVSGRHDNAASVGRKQVSAASAGGLLDKSLRFRVMLPPSSTVERILLRVHPMTTIGLECNHGTKYGPPRKCFTKFNDSSDFGNKTIRVYNKYVRERAEEERKEKKNKLQQKKNAFKQLMEEAKLHSKSASFTSPRSAQLFPPELCVDRSSFNDFSTKHGRDERFKGIEKARDRQTYFNEHIAEVRKREKEEKDKKREQTDDNEAVDPSL
ncbi:hypothetical protein MSG28_014814 [Choristoneura fumiferana]|uniref:Uncharacterized protein n=1 Tax=Choristoneura fumiferana TaxID=7141 RepID=A0ACC0JT63_CHOFU|nr:hypothetical protein MSG28_014814 [Choristoneura fumiferana]